MEQTDADRLVQGLQRFALASDRFIDRLAGLNGMHRTDLNALSAVMRHELAGEAPTASQVGRDLSLSSPATTAMLDRLERSGHVARERTDADRRVVRVTSTPKAAEDGRLMFGPMAHRLGAAFVGYTAEEVQTIERFLAEAATAMEAAAKDLTD